MTRASTPGSLSTITAIVCRFARSKAASPRRDVSRPRSPYPLCRSRGRGLDPLPRGPRAGLYEDHALFGRLRVGAVLRAQQHLVMPGAGGDHREAVLLLIDGDVDDHRPV